MSTTITCNLHDYLEIACMYGYRVRLTLKDGRIVEGQAVDTLTTAEKREFLVLDSEKVEIGQLAKLEVLTPNAQFKEVVF